MSFFVMVTGKKAGMTLIETIVAFAIIAIITVVAVTGFNTIANVGGKAQDMNAADQNMEALIAGGAAGASSAENITLVISAGSGAGSVQVEIPGKVLTYENAKNGRTLEVFIASPAKGRAELVEYVGGMQGAKRSRSGATARLCNAAGHQDSRQGSPIFGWRSNTAD